MSETAKEPPLFQESLRSFLRDYGMIFVLFFLVIFFSLLTLNKQDPTGAEAGKLLAETILRSHGENAGVLIVARDTADDRAFADGVEETLTAAGAAVLGKVNGSPADVRKKIEDILASGKQLDVVAANEVTARWGVFNSFPEVGAEKCVTPQPYLWPDFLKTSNLANVANQTAVYAIIAIGMTMVIITAGIDLSVGSLVALASVCSTLFLRDLAGGANASPLGVVAACLLGIAICAAAGLFNGVMVTAFRIPPFIVTLAMMMMASGLAFRLTEGRSVPEVPDSFKWIAGGDILGIPNQILLMLVLYVIGHIVMSQMIFGRYVYAIGGNEEAARLSGVPVKRILLVVYTLCGVLAGLGGIVLSSQLGAGDPKYGLMFELEVIAAVVVGGTSLMGGQGRIFGTLIGAFIIAVIKNGMNLTGVDPFNQKIVLGAVLLAAVLFDTLKRRQDSPIKLRDVIAVLTGCFTGGIVVGLVESLNMLLYPELTKKMAEIMETSPELMSQIEIPTGAILVVNIAWALGALAGGAAAAWFQPSRGKKCAIAVGLILMISNITSLMAIPSPVWFWITGLGVFIPDALLGAMLVRAIASTTREETT